MFAKLTVNQSTTPTVGEILEEAVKVITGTVTASSALTVFDPATSVINTTAATNWELVFPTATTALSNVFVLRSQCVDTNKYKYARLLAKGTGTNEPFVEPTGGTANVYSYTTYSTVYVEIDSCSAVDTGTGAVTNSTYKHQSNEGYRPGQYTMYISASERHLLIYSDYSSSLNPICLFAVFEYPETAVSTGKNLIPAIAYRGNGSNFTVTTTSLETATSPKYNVIQMPTGYTTSTDTVELQSVDALTSFNTFEFCNTYTGSKIPKIRVAMGSTNRQTIGKELVYYDSSRSHNFINASTLSDVYYLTDTTDNNATEYSIDNTVYQSLPLVNTTLLVPKG